MNPFLENVGTETVVDPVGGCSAALETPLLSPAPLTEVPDAHTGDAYRVLAIDGGGVRGILPARILTALEDEAGRPIAELFDLIVGTSIGGIAALALTIPGPDGSPRYTPDSAAALLTGHKDAIFPTGDLTIPHNIAQARKLASTVARTGLAATGRHRDRGNARYSPEPLEAALSDFFGGAMLSDAITPIVVNAFDALTDRPVHFRSAYAASLIGFDVPMSTVARAATAAPTFFPPVEVDWIGKQTVLLDAGVYANGVSLLAYTEARMHAAAESRSPDQIVLVSLGSGRQHGSPDDALEDFAHRHWVGLADRLMKAAEVGQQETHHRLLCDLLGDRYWRFQPTLPDGDGFGTDDASDEQLSDLVAIADRFVADNSGPIRQLASLLVSKNRRHGTLVEHSR